MSDEAPARRPLPSERYLLADYLEAASEKLQARKSLHFVDDKTVCNTCKNAQIMREGNKNGRVIHCRNLGEYVPTNLLECNTYSSVNELSLMQMSEIAYLIENKDKRVGFYHDAE